MKRTGNCLIMALALLCASLSLFAADKKSGDYVEMYSGEITSMNYLVTGSQVDHIMFANTIDGLIEYDQYGVVKPSLATSWTVSADGLVWTFKIRQGVKWYTYKAKEYAELTAQDWVDAAKYLLIKANASQTANVFYGVIKGAEDYWEGRSTDIATVGVKAPDKYTLQYTLAKPVPYFLSMLSYVSFLPLNGKFMAEVGPKFGTDNTNVLYNGAYIFSSYEPQSSRELVRNEKYWDKAKVPIKRLTYKYNKETATLSPELFLRGECSIATIPSSVLDSWMKDPAKKAQIHPARLTSYSYFYAFNFDPKFDAQYQPENWKAAVNDRAFREAIFHALDRKAAMLTAEPYTPENRLQNTITPSGFATAGGKDYARTGELAAIAKRDSFDKAAALKFRDQARSELAGKVTFPVKIPMPFRTDYTDWVQRAQVVEQQLEGLLGADFIDVIPLSYPATGFLGATRRAGNYAIQECNWGPDYADPETYTDPFIAGGSYNKPELALGYGAADKPSYESLVEAAKAETKDMKKRFQLFAKAEAYLINEAFVIPYSCGIATTGGGYEANLLEPFTCPFAPFGLSDLKFKGQAVMAKAISTEEYLARKAAWQDDRDKAIAKTDK
jgi:oligopeptide transport system substrate-binding protein